MLLITSRSSVAHAAGAAGSLSHRWMLAPPTKTTSSSSGPRAVATGNVHRELADRLPRRRLAFLYGTMVAACLSRASTSVVGETFAFS
jgi:hypothetical protein